MLPLPNLDDRTFEQLMREARDLIPGIFPEWTDENIHDPGITLLEMLAWHLEVQQYRLDRLTTNHERKFLKLLGEAPRDRLPARSSVVFTGTDQSLLVPRGTLLRAGDIPYETERTMTVIPDRGIRMTVTTSTGTVEVTAGDEAGSAPFYPFGPDAAIGARFTVRFPEHLPANVPLSLWVELADEPGGPVIARIPPNDSLFVPSAQVAWEYWDEAEDGTASWQQLTPLNDETYSLHQSGSVRFALPRFCRRIAAVLVSGTYDRVPRVRRWVWNEVPVVQEQTHSIVEAFDSTGEAGLVLEPTHALFRNGIVLVQVRLSSDSGQNGWLDWEETETWPDSPESVFRVDRTDTEVLVRFGDGGKGAIPPSGASSIRLIAVSPELYSRMNIGQGTGISSQWAELPLKSVLPNHLQLQVGWLPEGAGALLWQDWTRVPDFDRSQPDSLHYVFEDADDIIRFSDGTRGAVPAAAPLPNIRVISLRTGGGAGGNVKEGQIRVVDGLPAGAQPRLTNIRPATGGADPESTGDALRRVQRSVLEPDCGVTAEDIERIVKRIPGLCLARVKAIPGFRPGITNYPEERAFGHVAVVVVPYVRGALPRPSTGFLQTVRNHLEPYRLLTTKFHVMPPEYVKVTVRAIVVVDPRYDGRERRVNEALNQLLQPYGDDAGAGGWEFGRPIYKGDVYDAIHHVPGVLYIQDVWLTADGKDVLKEEGGDIRIPPNALVVSGQHEIEFISSQR